MLTNRELHEKILYPLVRVRTTKAGGSGTVIYSKPDPETEGEYQTFILTCAHVIEEAITYKTEFHPVLKKDIKKEILQKVDVELFDYVYLSQVNSSNTYKADIVAYDKSHDIAILKLNTPKECSYVSQLIPKEEIRGIKLFTPTWTSGCSLLHDPFANAGYITYLTDMIDNRLYWMGNGSSIFGNSGGAVFLAETGQQIGISARITVIPVGFGSDVITWMGWFIAPQRFYEFFDEQEIQFLYNPSDTYTKSVERRAKKAKEALFLRMSKEEDDEK